LFEIGSMSKVFTGLLRNQPLASSPQSCVTRGSSALRGRPGSRRAQRERACSDAKREAKTAAARAAPAGVLLLIALDHSILLCD